MPIRFARLSTVLALALGCAGLAGGIAPASARELPAVGESREVLEEACRGDGTDAATCSCLGEFVVANFSQRELQGAAMVFSDPMLVSDPAAAITSLLEEGYSLDEITGVVERVMSLEQAATTTCAVEDGGSATPDE